MVIEWRARVLQVDTVRDALNTKFLPIFLFHLQIHHPLPDQTFLAEIWEEIHEEAVSSDQAKHIHRQAPVSRVYVSYSLINSARDIKITPILGHKGESPIGLHK